MEKYVTPPNELWLNRNNLDKVVGECGRSVAIHSRLKDVMILFGLEVHKFGGLPDDQIVISNGKIGDDLVVVVNIGKEELVPEVKRVRRVIRCR